MEYKLFEGDVPHVSTYDFHEHRERAPHMEQAIHRSRLDMAYDFANDVWSRVCNDNVECAINVVDLGCGDGGQIQRMNYDARFVALGYDFQPSNIAGWLERGQSLNAMALNFVDKWYAVAGADLYMITECLEHLANPHQMVRQIHARNAYIIASSPFTETFQSHDECHAWAWDPDGYAQLITQAGFRILNHERTGMFQVILGEPSA